VRDELMNNDWLNLVKMNTVFSFSIEKMSFKSS